MNDILRLIAGGLLALCSSYIGLVIKRRYADREKFYSSLCQFLDSAVSELSFRKTPVPQIADNFCSGRKGEFEKFIKEYVALAKEGKSYEQMLEKLQPQHIKPDEKKEILTFLCTLGKTSLDDQLKNVNRAQAIFSQKRDELAKENKKLGGMYFKLCVLLGLAIIIFLA